ncbi:ATP-binding cassette domain-containing protein [Malacoplasma penetrans]|uniref:ABC transporter ATP-binding protein n=1 Tax=Malacoplasma penetrans (strain HF-2) TaxID=272633 RepID=Q8EW49_MALP2|nr:ATP-binding cassette domain-containing protein [Malacoplasma penetrans]RXY96272.1 ATP-binding cassette domain-containing protein [Malacoplasma penetrans]BAC44147.1 ABC transporter ATP-binding protein [Malacoplasma penetrans HF-2]
MNKTTKTNKLSKTKETSSNQDLLIKNLKSLLDNNIIDNNEYSLYVDRINNKFLSVDDKNKKQDNKDIDHNEREVVLEVINLTKHYPRREKPAIKDLNFKLRKNQFHVFIGANGAGKTTTIKALVGAYAKWEGLILINGKENTKTVSKLNVGYIPEKSVFPKNMSTKQYLVSMAMMSGIKKELATEFANKTLLELNMQNMANKNPNTFSSGQQKKILLSQALVHNPDILIMDEPTANLDPISRNEFYTLTKKLQEQGKTIFVSSHILSEVEKYADYVTILDGGRIVYSGPLDQNKDLEKLYFSYVKEGSVDTGIKKDY